MKQLYVTGGIALGVLGLGYLAWRGIAGKVADGTLNPADKRNFINQGVERIGQDITGDSSWSLGGALYDLFNDDPDITATIPRKGEVIQ